MLFGQYLILRTLTISQFLNVIAVFSNQTSKVPTLTVSNRQLSIDRLLFFVRPYLQDIIYQLVIVEQWQSALRRRTSSAGQTVASFSFSWYLMSLPGELKVIITLSSHICFVVLRLIYSCTMTFLAHMNVITGAVDVYFDIARHSENLWVGVALLYSDFMIRHCGRLEVICPSWCALTFKKYFCMTHLNWYLVYIWFRLGQSL